MYARGLVLSVLAVCVACGSSNAGDPVVAAGSGSDKPAPKKPDGSGSSAGSAHKGEHVVLPKASDTPPKPTTAKLDKAAFDRLAALDYPSFTVLTRRQTDTGLIRDYKTKTHPYISVTVDVGHCFDCQKMDLATWKKKETALKNHIPPVLRDRKDTVFTVDEVKLNGATMIGTYQLASNLTDKLEGDAEQTYTEAYNLYYNDGNNQIRVMTSYADDPVKSTEAMTRIVPRDDLELVAKRFMDAYTHAW